MCFKKAIENILCHQICKDMSMENQAKGGTYSVYEFYVMS